MVNVAIVFLSSIMIFLFLWFKKFRESFITLNFLFLFFCSESYSNNNLYLITVLTYLLFILVSAIYMIKLISESK